MAHRLFLNDAVRFGVGQLTPAKPRPSHHSSEMKFTKPALSQQKLIELMIQRGLPLASAEATTEARRVIDRIGYFRLSGFMLPFMQGGGDGQRHRFRAGASIEKIVALHDLDASLRLHCMEGLSQLEVAIRASICDHLSRSYGAHWHQSCKPFKPGNHLTNLRALANAAGFDLDRGQPRVLGSVTHPFIERYYLKYTDPATRIPPGWMVRECASFRTWAFLFDGLESAEQKQISDAWRFPSGKRIDHRVLQDWFHSLSILRNRCAHHGRITHKRFPFAPLVARDPSVSRLFVGPGTDLRTLIVVMAVLIRCVDPRSTWIQKLYRLLDWQSLVDVEDATGFCPLSPGTWREDPLWDF